LSPSHYPLPVTVFLGLGSNVDPKIDSINLAVKELRELFPAGFKISAYYNTRPYKGLIQDSYLNCCVSFSTSHPPQYLLQLTQNLEMKMGRVRSYNPWESRIIDIDILLYGDNRYQFDNLVIPHYDLSNRDFFLIPLLELDSNLINPATGEFLDKELAKLPTKLKTIIKKVEPERQKPYPNRFD
jgi:2-amino-4-hydroxy-6-hydroxymethyldihydropteridine diphosphokinase